MRKNHKKSLSLNTQTVRSLQDASLENAVGAGGDTVSIYRTVLFPCVRSAGSCTHPCTM